MKSQQNFSIVQHMKAYCQFELNNLYFSDDLHTLQKESEGLILSQNSINTNLLLLPDLKSIIFNESDLLRLNEEGRLQSESYLRSVSTDTSSKLPIIRDQQDSDISVFSEFNEF